MIVIRVKLCSNVSASLSVPRLVSSYWSVPIKQSNALGETALMDWKPYTANCSNFILLFVFFVWTNTYYENVIMISMSFYYYPVWDIDNKWTLQRRQNVKESIPVTHKKNIANSWGKFHLTHVECFSVKGVSKNTILITIIGDRLALFIMWTLQANQNVKLSIPVTQNKIFKIVFYARGTCSGPSIKNILAIIPRLWPTSWHFFKDVNVNMYNKSLLD